MKIKKQNNKWFFTADIGGGLCLQHQFANLKSAISEAIELSNQNEIKWDTLDIEASYVYLLQELEKAYQEGYNSGSNAAKESIACQLDEIINKAGLNKNG